jgi:eukaryotic-like serine/threonine-protein kinase
VAPAGQAGYGPPPDPPPGGKGPATPDRAPAPATPDRAPSPAGPRAAGKRRGVLLVAAAAAVVIAGGVTAALVLTGGSGGTPGAAGPGTYTASGPWRLMIQDSANVGTDNGCNVTLTDTQSGQTIKSVQGLYGTHTYQIHQAGSFRWHVNDPMCLVTTPAGPGHATLPFSWLGAGDTDAFTAPANVTVHVDDYASSPNCTITLSDPASGQLVDSKTATPGQNQDTVTLDPGGRKTVYLTDTDCKIRVTAATPGAVS